MQVDGCYTEKRESVCLMKFVSQTQFDQMKATFSEQMLKSVEAQPFTAKAGEVAYLTEYVLIGTGQEEEVETALAHAVLKLKPGCYATESNLSFRAQLLWSLAQYRFDKYRSSSYSPRVLYTVEAKALIQMAEAIFLVRDLINTPAQDMGPEGLEKAAAQLAERYTADLQVYTGDELLKEGYPAIHAVGRAASSAPRLIHLGWGSREHATVALVGKGVCFDSGGLDLKTAGGMRLMKKDMGGAAHVLGLAQWVMASQLPIRLEVLVPAVENAVGPNAYRPGDILRMRNGLTVEIENTDAEGRLVLADALVKACELKSALIIDFATLTGAARVAVGTEMAAMFTHDDKLAEDLSASSKNTRDPIWRLPLFEPYLSMLDSTIADLMNASASSYAGAITAALFLQHFVEKTVPWVHFDVMAWNVANKPGKPEGGEAMGLRAVADYLEKQFLRS